MRALFAIALVLLAGCEQLQEHVVLKPQGEQVEFAMDTPSDHLYDKVGDIEAVAAGHDVSEAEQSARNDLRNQAAARGATLVTVDSVQAELVRFQDKQKVTIKGRAFKPKE